MIKDNLKYIIIGLSIIIASVIVVLFFPDPNHSRNDCYRQFMNSAENIIREDKYNNYDAQKFRSSRASYARDMCK